MMHTINVPDAVVDHQIELIHNRPRNHIFCNCDTSIMFCGVYLPPHDGEVIEDMPDGDECSDCYLVWLSGYCPRCGRHWTEQDYRSQGL